jgi:hypothetical protein
MKRRTLLLGAAALTGAARAQRVQRAQAEPDRVGYPLHLPQHAAQVGYFVELMRLALARSGRRYELRPTRHSMVQGRALIELARPDSAIDVFWTMSHPERERQLLPVRVPLERGLVGWRLALVRRADRERWRDLRRLDELARASAGQMSDWPDTEILRANGLPVVTSSHYQGLFEMLAAGRFDYFPRSIIEIDAELAAYHHLGLEIEPRLLLHYPAALYLYVNPHRPQLAEALRAGMEALVADGTFERLSRRQFGALPQQHHVAERQVLRLSNPLLSPATPLARKALWFALPG